MNHNAFRNFAKSTRGATAIEYGLIVSLIFLGIIGGINAFGNSTDGSFKGSTDKINAGLTSR